MLVSSKVTKRLATIEGVVVLDRRYFGLTVSHSIVGVYTHPSDDNVDAALADLNDEPDFALEFDEEGDDEDEIDMSDTNITSQGTVHRHTPNEVT